MTYKDTVAQQKGDNRNNVNQGKYWGEKQNSLSSNYKKCMAVSAEY